MPLLFRDKHACIIRECSVRLIIALQCNRPRPRGLHLCSSKRKRTPLKRHEETEKRNEMKDE